MAESPNQCDAVDKTKQTDCDQEADLIPVRVAGQWLAATERNFLTAY
jgi:hypothetical protein